MCTTRLTGRQILQDKCGLYEKSMPLLKTYVLRHALQDFYFWSTVHQTVFPNVLTIGGTDSTLKLINNSYSAAHILLLLL